MVQPPQKELFNEVMGGEGVGDGGGDTREAERVRQHMPNFSG